MFKINRAIVFLPRKEQSDFSKLMKLMKQKFWFKSIKINENLSLSSKTINDIVLFHYLFTYFILNNQYYFSHKVNV